ARRVENVIDLIEHVERSDLVPNYVVTAEFSRNLVSILELLTDREVQITDKGPSPRQLARDRKPIQMLIGAFGTGKTYFLLILAALAEGKGDSRQEFARKVSDFPALAEHVKLLNEARFMTVKIRLTDFTSKALNQVLLESLSQTLIDRLDEVPGSFYKTG